MKRKNNLLSLMLCVSLALHGILFFLVSLYPVTNSRLPDSIQSPDPFALVNLTPIEPAPPKPLPPPPVLPAAMPAAIPEDIIEPAETLIPVADLIPVTIDLPPAAETTADGSAADAAEKAALSKDYVKRNYTYIMSSIQRKLLYPLPARRTGIQGTAEISFTVHEDGQVSDVRISKSSGSEILDAAALESIYAASPFRPPPAEARLAIPVTFRLK
ncbi:hypothetical protein AGMMS49942_22540 [Spirochaetia bacterium]|nr:hypothetical protein AGMMS49942_22540 [Spirochaetia bacterium]